MSKAGEWSRSKIARVASFTPKPTTNSTTEPALTPAALTIPVDEYVLSGVASLQVEDTDWACRATSQKLIGQPPSSTSTAPILAPLEYNEEDAAAWAQEWWQTNILNRLNERLSQALPALMMRPVPVDLEQELCACGALASLLQEILEIVFLKRSELVQWTSQMPGANEELVELFLLDIVKPLVISGMLWTQSTLAKLNPEMGIQTALELVLADTVTQIGKLEAKIRIADTAESDEDTIRERIFKNHQIIRNDADKHNERLLMALEFEFKEMPQITDSEKCLALLSCLDLDDSLSLRMSLETQGWRSPARLTWNMLEKAFLDLYVSPYQLAHELLYLKQGEDESAKVYVERANWLVARVPYGLLIQTIIVDGLNDSEVKRDLYCRIFEHARMTKEHFLPLHELFEFVVQYGRIAEYMRNQYSAESQPSSRRREFKSRHRSRPQDPQSSGRSMSVSASPAPPLPAEHSFQEEHNEPTSRRKSRRRSRNKLRNRNVSRDVNS